MKTLAEISLRESDRAAIADAARVLRSRFSAKRVMLFGSKATGSNDEESDIDLLVLTSRNLDWRERGDLSDALFEIGMAHGVVISPLVVPAAEWDRGRITVLPIHDAIADSGVLV